MSCGSVCVVLLYVNVVGDVLALLFVGINVLSMFACCLGSFVFLICSVMCCFLASFMFLLSLFLYFLCLVMLSVVGCFIIFSCSLCCRLICLLCFGVHHVLLLCFGVVSWVCIVFLIAICRLCSCCDVVVVVVSVFDCDSMIACFMSVRMESLCLLYLAADSVLVLHFCFLFVLVWKMV